jgi:hypothetical protein
VNEISREAWQAGRVCRQAGSSVCGPFSFGTKFPNIHAIVTLSQDASTLPHPG